MYFLTAQHFLGGPMYCITAVAGSSPAGTAAVSAAGGPILTPEACAALPPATYSPQVHLKVP